MDKEQLKMFCKEAIEENKAAVDDYLKGNDASIHFVIGKVMCKTKGTVKLDVVKELLIDCIKTRGMY